jgi:hypothetical protein
MKKKNFFPRLALAAATVLLFLPVSFADTYTPPVGGFATDGTVFAGATPIANKPVYTTPDDAPDLFSWNDAGNYCSTLHEFGHDDWRLPDKRELAVLYDNRKVGALNGTFNKTGGPAGWYWSSSESGGGQAWVLRFTNGEENYDYEDDKSSARCVR